MKRIIYGILALAMVGILTRLPHPAADVGRLEPVQVVRISGSTGKIRIHTDTGASGEGETLAAAVSDMQEKASGVIFLETAQFVVLEDVMLIEPTIYEILRPTCRVCVAGGDLDLSAMGAYLSIHPPEWTIAQLRAAGGMEIAK